MATAIASPVFIDTNVLVFAHSALAPLHTEALSTLQNFFGAGAELWVSRQIFREYLAGMTRPGAFTGAAPLASLLTDIQSFEAQFHVAEDGPAVTAQLLTLLSQVSCGGKQVHDANIVATMLAHGVPNLLTNNPGDFARFAPYITVVPLVPPVPPPPGVP
jgi:predicted nucleic acid-binding protein